MPVKETVSNVYVVKSVLEDSIEDMSIGLRTHMGMPCITELNPDSGGEGDPVTISGFNFGAIQGTSKVYFGGDIEATVTSWSDTAIEVTVPVGAITGAVWIKVDVTPSNKTKYFTVT